MRSLVVRRPLSAVPSISRTPYNIQRTTPRLWAAWGQPVETTRTVRAWMGSLSTRTTARIMGGVHKTHLLHTFCTRLFPTLSHLFNRSPVSVNGIVFPAFHRTNKYKNKLNSLYFYI
jgi:hypothetical protein